MKTLSYLAVPYSHDDPEIRQERFQVVNQVAAKLMRRGEYIFSPISHSHPIALVGDLPKEWEYWKGFCRSFMECCVKLYVLKLEGWEESKGVQAEIKIAKELHMEIEYLDTEEIVYA